MPQSAELSSASVPPASAGGPASDLQMAAQSALCAHCGGQNLADSRFCRHCGQPMAAAEAPSSQSVSEQIDVRRAKQLVERAQSLAERGDVHGAILACRQSVALAPSAVESHSLLASLLHRSGDSAGAAAEYEKVLQLAPDSVLEKEALKNIRSESHAAAGDVFRFDDGELFDEAPSVTEAETVAIPPAMGSPVPMNVAASPASPPLAPVAPPPEAARADSGRLAGPGLAAEQMAALRPNPHLRRMAQAAPPAPERPVTRSPEGAAQSTDAGAKAGPFSFSSEAAEAPAPPRPAPRPPMKPQVIPGAGVVGTPLVAPVTPPAPVAAAPTAVPAPVPPAPVVSPAAAAPPAPAPPAPARRSEDRRAGDARASDRRNMSVPVAVERRRRPDRREDEPVAEAVPVPIDFNALPSPVPPMVTPASQAALRASARGGVASARTALPPVDEEDELPLWRRWASDNLMLRVGVPLGLVVVVGLAVTAWSLNRPVSFNALPAGAPAAQIPPQAAPGIAPVQASGTPIGPPPTSSPAVISNAPVLAGASAAVPAKTHKTGHALTSKPLFPNPGMAPAAIPALGGNAPESALPPAQPSVNGGIGSLPAPQIGAPAPAPVVVQALPPDDVSTGGDLNSSGGIPLNPAGSPNTGYITITQSHIPPVAAPPRPSNQARNTERDAAAAARAGNNGAAINGITNALNTDASDQGYRYQTRANLFLQRGDYRRAIDDFQNAIAAYNNQIGRGEDITTAQAGLRASQSGLNVAYAGLRSGE